MATSPDAPETLETLETLDKPETQENIQSPSIEKLKSELYWAIYDNEIKKVAEILEAEPSLLNQSISVSGDSPLFVSVRADIDPERRKTEWGYFNPRYRERDCSITHLLLEKGANYNQTDKDGKTLIMDIALQCSKSMINNNTLYLLKLLVEKYQANVNLEDKDNRTALFYALISENLDAIEFLISQGANFKYLSKNSEMASTFDPKILRLMFKAGALEYLSTEQLESTFGVMLHKNFEYHELDLMRVFFEQYFRFNRMDKAFYPMHRLCEKILFHSNAKALLHYLLVNGMPFDAARGYPSDNCLYKLENRKTKDETWINRFKLCAELFQQLTLKFDADALKALFRKADDLLGRGAFLTIRTVVNHNTILHMACESNLAAAKLLLDELATVPLEVCGKALAAENAEKSTALDILKPKKTQGLDEKNLRKALITQIHNLIQNFANKSVMSADQIMKLSLGEKSPLQRVPAAVKGLIFQFLQFEPASKLVEKPSFKKLFETGIQRAAVSSEVQKMIERLWLLNKPQAVTHEIALNSFPSRVNEMIWGYCNDEKPGKSEFEPQRLELTISPVNKVKKENRKKRKRERNGKRNLGKSSKSGENGKSGKNQKFV